MKRILFIEKKQRNLVLGLFGLIFIIVAVLSWTITQKGQEVIDTEVQNYLTETSQQTSYKVNQRVNHNIDQLTILAQHLNHVDKNQYQNLILILLIIVLLNGLVLLIKMVFWMLMA